MRNIQQTINHYRQLLAKNADSICFADIKDGFVGELPLLNEKSLNAQHSEMLKIFNGGRFGDIDIWSIEDLPSQQFYLNTELFDNFAKGDSDMQDYFSWNELPSFYIFAQVLYEPILLNRNTGEVIFPTDYDTPCQIKPLVNFIGENVLGINYAELLVLKGVQETDDWLEFIQKSSIG